MKINYNNHRKELLKKTVEIKGTKCIIRGLGDTAFKMAFKAPEGFSTKGELASFFVSYENMSPALKKQVNSYIKPKKSKAKAKDEDEEFLSLLS